MKKTPFTVLYALTTVSLLLGLAGNANAAIYKCVNSKGETYYNDKACPKSDKETQLNNVKDPTGGYIPPDFKADAKAQGSKGVVVGESTDANNDNKSSDDVSDSENIKNSKDADNSSDTDLNNDIANGDVIENIQLTSGKRVRRKGVRKNPLPTVPLKKETVTPEPRAKINKS